MPRKSANPQAAPNLRRGLRKLECDSCDFAPYMTWSQCERFGMPACPEHGATVFPTDLELALALELDNAPVVAEFHRQASRVMHGQASHLSKSLAGDRLRSPEDIAYERVCSERRLQARENRLSALRPAAEPMPF